MKILIDNGHGENTPGKRSPDGKFREYLYSREIAEAIERDLRMRGYDAERIVPETVDVPLAERARRVNEFCGKLGASNVILISVHCNAAGNGDWDERKGLECLHEQGQHKPTPSHPASMKRLQSIFRLAQRYAATGRTKTPTGKRISIY